MGLTPDPVSGALVLDESTAVVEETALLLPVLVCVADCARALGSTFPSNCWRRAASRSVIGPPRLLMEDMLAFLSFCSRPAEGSGRSCYIRYLLNAGNRRLLRSAAPENRFFGAFLGGSGLGPPDSRPGNKVYPATRAAAARATTACSRRLSSGVDRDDWV